MKTYLKFELIPLIIITLFTSVPYILIKIYLSKIPYVEIFFLLILAVYKFVIFKELNFQNSKKDKLISFLSKDGRPSNQIITNKLKQLTMFRDSSLIINGIVIVIYNILNG